MNINERIELAEKLIAEVKAELKQDNGKWIPKREELCYGVYADGSINRIKYRTDFFYHVELLKRGRIFSTKEEAEFFSEQELVRAELWAFADDDQEWEDINTHWVVMHRNGELIPVSLMSYCMDIPYFKSNQSCQNAIDTVGADRIKKYLFGVK